MQKLEIIPEDVGKYMEQTAQQRGQTPQQIPAQQFPNMGMMPGSNPMDLLQMQQMQQMQQMFQNMNQKWVDWWMFYILYYLFLYKIYWYEIKSIYLHYLFLTINLYKS